MKSATGPDSRVTTEKNTYGIAEYTPFKTMGYTKRKWLYRPAIDFRLRMVQTS